jgi:hypothetical protein
MSAALMVVRLRGAAAEVGADKETAEDANKEEGV